MKKSLLFLICIFTLFVFSIKPVYSVNEPYRSIANGNWSEIGIWELYNGSIWLPAVIPPSYESGQISLFHKVIVDINVEVDQLISYDSLIIGTNKNLSVLDGPGTDFTNFNFSTVLGPGTILTKGNEVTIVGGGMNMIVNLEVYQGSLKISQYSFYNNLLTIDSSCSLTILSGNTANFYSEIINNGSIFGFGKFYGNVINNGTINGYGIGNSVYIYTSSFMNNGIITDGTYYLYGSSFTNNGIFTNSTATWFNNNYSIINNGTMNGIGVNSGATCGLQGTGFCGNIGIYNSSVLIAENDIKAFKVIINPGTVFDISNHTLFVSADFNHGNVITNNGTLITTNSTIEYNGTAIQDIVTNINYKNLRINNPAGVRLFGNDLDINDTLSLISGDLTMYSAIITLPTSAYLKETPGNTITGSGYITTTRALNAPLNLNVGGLGAIITSSSDLGSTEIRRYNATQNNVNGSTSILRYYDITPTNNSGLNASIVYKYDDSELNGKPESSLQLFRSTNSGSTWTFRGGNINTSTNEISLSGIDAFSRWTAGGGYLTSQIRIIPEGFYNVVTGKMNSKDTVRAYLRNISSPYVIADSAKSLVDSVTFTVNFTFINAPSGTYYIEVKHRNSIETWSKSGGETYSLGNVFTYDFTNGISQAFGNNMVLKGSKSCIYSGDPNQDGSVDATDVLEIYNDANSFSNGYVSSDLTGDKIVDVTDILISYNNSGNFVGKLTP